MYMSSGSTIPEFLKCYSRCGHIWCPPIMPSVLWDGTLRIIREFKSICKIRYEIQLFLILDLVLWQACERKDYYSLVLLVVLFEGDREWRIWFHVSICPNSLVGTKLTHRNTDFDLVILVLLVKRLKQNNLFYAFPHFFSLWLFEVLPTL